LSSLLDPLLCYRWSFADACEQLLSITRYPLLLVIFDQANAELLKVRWRSALQICADCLGARPWAVVSVSPALEAMASTPTARLSSNP